MEQRENCPHCDDTRQRFYQRDTPSGTVQFCHNCGFKGFIPIKERTPEQIVAYLKRYMSGDTPTDIVTDIKLPYDFSSMIPILPKMWLKKYDITDEEIDTFGIGWSDNQQRLILPVYKEGHLTYYQGRTFSPITKDNPKYRNIRQSGAKNVFFTRGWDLKTPVAGLCIVEDILSAIKVGRHIPTLALLGSYFPMELNPLYCLANHLFIWLDQDKHATAIKQSRKINTMFGVPCTVLSTEKDPKECRDISIKSLIGL